MTHSHTDTHNGMITTNVWETFVLLLLYFKCSRTLQLKLYKVLHNIESILVEKVGQKLLVPDLPSVVEHEHSVCVCVSVQKQFSSHSIAYSAQLSLSPTLINGHLGKTALTSKTFTHARQTWKLHSALKSHLKTTFFPLTSFQFHSHVVHVTMSVLDFALCLCTTTTTQQQL